MEDVKHGREVDTFAQMDPIFYTMWDITAVRVEFKGQLHWRDEFIYVVLLDKNREKMYAKVPSELRSYVEGRMKTSRMYRLNYVTMTCVDDREIEFQHYQFTRGRETVFIILLNKRSSIVEIPHQISFPLHPNVPTIKEISEIQRGKYLTDVFGQICYGGKVEYYKRDWNRGNIPKLQIFLLDRTATVISLVLKDQQLTHNMGIVDGIRKKSFVLITRVKVKVAKPLNRLKATDISRVYLDPVMPESFYLSDRLKIIAKSGEI